MEQFLKDAKDASGIASTLSGAIKNKVLNDMADSLLENISRIENENKKDIESGKENNLSSALMDRLLLNETRISDMATAIRDIAALKEPVGKIHEGWTTDSGLNIQKVSVPIGVIGIIYESRPNVTSDTAALCLKSGNVCILKGGKEALHSNTIIAQVLQEALIKNNLPKALVSLLPDSSREAVANLIKQDEYVDLIIPRGGSALIKYISSNASVPVVKHDKGLCHTYIHKDANIQKAIDVSINAKCRRAGICGAMETMLVDNEIATTILPLLKDEFDKYNTELRGCDKTQAILDINKADSSDWEEEYLDNILSIKIVENVKEAISHIRQYGSDHSDAIITENYTDAETFLNSVDSACVYLNASTQFTDGGQFGFGAEVGISTNKLHARGPMGINELTTYKFKILGNGQTRP
ncbi:MAG: glutamate-5-semialdehyde dehydrogenase [Campylobacteraceae bacterium]|jgi:glutamate-5-semialdehyde dehydrogenase|nr:glutamate-5-semialdehyde dehydrogenase [Campylobacteraceae bacterium]MBT3882221.1 glutamate-5-semialdehyde dehydrogenase [Campylobacteraceae bacterium]MBT4030625.1 glutamate-5-semialdehyde dehydrogenase [Campylobacteraceae bacterium]MBT4571940.1 glutamate-5-semialdehyde dehydrogenase [Campylobacteraceae bacterium]MBT5323604.1 glutamate-5-semialdehyde dehydrogenase [Campylobacteraceae bacterium]